MEKQNPLLVMGLSRLLWFVMRLRKQRHQIGRASKVILST
jgi:hypothetical protein